MPSFRHVEATGDDKSRPKINIEIVSQRKKEWGNWSRRCLFLTLFVIVPTSGFASRTAKNSSAKSASSPAATKKVRQDDSFNSKPSADLALSPQSAHRADALTHFVEGMSLEENGEMDRALEAYRKVLNVDPGQSQLASRVAALLIEQDDFPQAIDVLKDAIKANPKDADPYQQLAYIYAKYLKKTDQAIDYANRGITLNPG